jgi:hypothetical protein
MNTTFIAEDLILFGWFVDITTALLYFHTLKQEIKYLIQEKHPYQQRWASLPPEVTVKSLPLPTNLKNVTVNSFSLPA